jgi:hypothetical protein
MITLPRILDVTTAVRNECAMHAEESSKAPAHVWAELAAVKAACERQQPEAACLLFLAAIELKTGKFSRMHAALVEAQAREASVVAG